MNIEKLEENQCIQIFKRCYGQHQQTYTDVKQQDKKMCNLQLISLNKEEKKLYVLIQ